MGRRTTIAIAAACLLAGAFGSGVASAAPAPPVAYCSTPGSPPGSCEGWFTTDVTVAWTYDPTGVTRTDCNVVTITADTSGTLVTCRVWYGSDYVESGKVIRRDATPPQVTGAAPDRPPDGNGWYARPVTVTFSGTDATSGLASCSQVVYGGPDSTDVTVAGTCRDNAGNTSSSGGFALRYDATPPAVTVQPDRPADASGWYTRRVTIAFGGSDAASGIGSCDAPVAYSGPDAAEATVSGSCRDAAGNVGAPASLAFRYDATPPPAPTSLEVEAGDGMAQVIWRPSAAAKLYEIVRMPGIGGAKRSTVYRGTAGTFVDRRVRNGVRYRWEVRSYDQAGNSTARVVAAMPLPPVYAPAAGTVVGGPPVVAWQAVDGARFYNVQVHVGKRKVLTTWPNAAKLALALSWVFEGKRYRLANGRYRVYVWPAFGTRGKPKYGRLLGQTEFVVRRA